jgi:3-dehydro-L-gulonate 2-dehydrogenase
MTRVPFGELLDTLQRILLKLDFEREPAQLCARLFAETSRDGVYSHGLNRFPRFVRAIHSGIVDVHATPELVTSSGALERWDGRRGPGNVNAHGCMGRALELARQQGVGCVALANTNHWMRGGSYGWQAAEAGAISICWTNTMPNLPPWGSADPLLGNNPLVIAVPRPGGHVVVDMAMSQFSYGVLEQYRMRGELLPVDGGFDRQGRPTRDPAEIEASGRMLPMGYWKGSGLALVLDLMAGFLSGGQFTRNIALGSEKESGLSQVFIAFDVARLDPHGVAARMAEEVVQSVSTKARATGEPVRYPGERVLQVRNENMARGIPVEPAIWESVRAM